MTNISDMNHFHTRITALRYIAASNPRWIGRTELSGILTGNLRTHQRALKELVKAGYLECDNEYPAGYRIIKSKFKEFKAL